MTRFCIEPGCLKFALYNHPGDPPMFCKPHADFEGGMVNVMTKKCKNFTVCGNYAQSGLNGFCISCARKDGWNGKVKKMCPCGKQAQVDGLCISCARKDGWEGVIYECKNKCGKQARVDGFCISCARSEGWEGKVKQKMCSCGKKAQVGGLCISCARKDGWEGKLKQKMCPCGKRAVVNELCVSCARKDGWKGKLKEKMCLCGKCAVVNELCISCYNEKHGIIRNPAVNAFKNFLKSKFPEYKLKTEFYILNYQLDFLIEMEELFIGIEYDQDQHKNTNYIPEEERKRETKIFQKLSSKKRTCVIRFNPSKYKVREKKYNPPMEERLKKLEDLISECIFDESKSGIFRLFYDE